MYESNGRREKIVLHAGTLSRALLGLHERLRAAELERARRLLTRGTPPDLVLDQLARRLTNKFLHAPTVALNRAGSAERTELAALVRSIYRLPEAQQHAAQDFKNRCNLIQDN